MGVEGTTGAAPASVTAALRELEPRLGTRLVVDPDVVAAYSRDRCAIASAGRAAAVVLARSVDDVQATMRAASRHGVAVVPRGAGSGLSGGANAIDDGIVLVTSAMDRVVDVDARDLVAVVQPGVITGHLQKTVRESGLEYTPDPASAAFCTIGGNIATNAGGLCCVKYGVTRDSVLALQVVRADGSLLHVGGRTVKSSAGLDLLSLFVGSEGTLGVVVEATLRLRPVRPTALTLLAFFASLHDAGAAITAVRGAVVPSLMEVMDGTTVRAVEEWRPQGLDAGAAALLIVQSDASGDVAAREIDTVRELCRAAGATDVLVADDAVETEMLLGARRLAFPALERRGAVLLDDVGVPCSRVAELLDGIAAVAARHDVCIGTFGHAGDGNMHPTIVFDPADPGATEVAIRAFDDIVATALRLGGTVTGEHGVGALKRSHLAQQVGEESLRLQREIKQVLDPQGICNPGRGY